MVVTVAALPEQDAAVVAFVTAVDPIADTMSDADAALKADVPLPLIRLPEEKLDAPVPPSATAKSVMPVIEPPVIATLLAFWVDIVPNEPVAFVTAVVTNAVLATCVVFVPADAVGTVGVPVNAGDATGATLVPMTSPRFVRAFAAVDAPVPPSATAKSVMPVIEPPVIVTLDDACVAIVPKPKFVRASAAVEAPVPPSATAKSVVSVKLDKWLFWKAKLVPSDQTVTVLPAGTATPAPAAVVLPRTVEL